LRWISRRQCCRPRWDGPTRSSTNFVIRKTLYGIDVDDDPEDGIDETEETLLRAIAEHVDFADEYDEALR